MHMIADIVGVPVDDRAWLFSKARDFLERTDPKNPIPAEQQLSIQLEICQCGRELGKEKRRQPADDVSTLLTTVEVEDESGVSTSLNELELDLFFIMLIVAGSETTCNAITVGLLELVDAPNQLAALREDSSLMKPAVEEMIRWSSPVSYFARRATRKAEIRGVPIAVGDRVTLWYPSGPSTRRSSKSPSDSTSAVPPSRISPSAEGVALLPGGEPRATRDVALLRGAARPLGGDRGPGRSDIQRAGDREPHPRVAEGAARAPLADPGIRRPRSHETIDQNLFTSTIESPGSIERKEGPET